MAMFPVGFDRSRRRQDERDFFFRSSAVPSIAPPTEAGRASLLDTTDYSSASPEFLQNSDASFIEDDIPGLTSKANP